MNLTIPALEEHEGIGVVRDDLFFGGTKARFIPQLFDDADEVVYASPCQGGAQFALASIAQQQGKRATIFVAHRQEPHPRALEAVRLGAKVVQVKPGYLSVVQARAREYAKEVGARLAPFGMDLPEAVELIASAARSLRETPDQVWASAGSGTLTRSLQAAWPDAKHFAVAVGRDLSSEEAGKATVIRYPLAFEKHAKRKPPFPSDPHYDAKAWEILTARRAGTAGRVVFWNVAAPALP